MEEVPQEPLLEALEPPWESLPRPAMKWEDVAQAARGAMPMAAVAGAMDAAEHGVILAGAVEHAMLVGKDVAHGALAAAAEDAEGHDAMSLAVDVAYVVVVVVVVVAFVVDNEPATSFSHCVVEAFVSPVAGPQ